MGRRPLGTGPRRVESIAGPEKAEPLELRLLPGGWHELVDEGSKEAYFWHSESGEVTWDRPGPVHPAGENMQQTCAAPAELSCSEIDELESTLPGARFAWNALCLAVKEEGDGAVGIRTKVATRLEDWRDGGLSGAFLATRMLEMAASCASTKAGLSPAPPPPAAAAAAVRALLKHAAR